MQARAHSLGLLPVEFRYQAANEIESAIVDDANAELLDLESVLELIPTKRLLHLLARIREEVLIEIPTMADRIVKDADLDAGR